MPNHAGGGGHYCLAWLCDPDGRIARSLVSSGGWRREYFQSAGEFSSESRSGFWLTRSVSVAWACRGFADGLITSLREPAFSLFSRSSALAFVIAFGDGCSMSAFGCLTADKRGVKNISFRRGVENFASSAFITNF